MGIVSDLFGRKTVSLISMEYTDLTDKYHDMTHDDIRTDNMTHDDIRTDNNCSIPVNSAHHLHSDCVWFVQCCFP